MISDLRPIVEDFFNKNPSSKDEVIKAFYAYHTHHPRHEDGSHDFSGPWRDCECSWCGRSREMVRYDDLPAQCQKRPDMPKIADVIKSEEESAFLLLQKAEGEVPKLIKKLGLSGATLAVLHHTHGYDPETVSSIVAVPRELMEEYHQAMEKEKERSRLAWKPKTIEVTRPI